MPAGAVGFATNFEAGNQSSALKPYPLALESMLTDRRPQAPPVTLEVRTGDQPIAIEARDGTIQVRLGSADRADATVTGPARSIMGLLLGLLPLANASGVELEGDQTVLDRIAAPG